MAEAKAAPLEMAARVASAVGGSAGATPRTGTPAINVSAQQIEDAMTEAVLQAAREGITDDATILSRKLAARSLITGS